MKKAGIINGPLSGALATLGHGHLVVIADCGLPVPVAATVVDLSLVRGIPSFRDVLDAVLDEIVVEGALCALEAEGSDVEQWLEDRDLAPRRITHDDLKGLLPAARLIIRTGEATPYANVILQCGVDF
ncbi:D-ribose pyranase [Arthrobacter sp. SX1312]|uniref:D-ribose pyranase n=1 Tax=Arthrobacter sp. SX1312 TaxID=2058896 RepID=UPI000CE384B4|nr:D-ribose pyranase [Arthrobacter sp. SX1312]